jgi:hypothetical protein
MNDCNYLKRKFPELGEELNKKEYLMLTFSIYIPIFKITL